MRNTFQLTDFPRLVLLIKPIPVHSPKGVPVLVLTNSGWSTKIVFRYVSIKLAVTTTKYKEWTQQ